MRAVWLGEFGGPEVLVAGEAPEPVAGPGEVLIDVEFANVTYVETQFRRTGFGPFGSELPVIPGNGVGGLVDGKRVVSSLRGSGGYAERAVAPAGNVLEVPAELDLAEAVALLADGRTALMLSRAAALRPGERVLVEAAAGGVGSLLVQLAKNAGAEVVAAAGGPEKLALAKELGADVAVDYRVPGWAPPVDVVFDGVGGEIGRAAFEAVRPGGRMFVFGQAGGEAAELGDAAERRVRVERGPLAKPEEMPELSRRALAEAAAGRLRPVIGQRFPLDRAADAHAAIESRATLGKTLLEVR
ncbi:zinc-binding dehydrogenase [Amycolatopsis sp. 195334CR]|uniref:zinc-binding dehydrogenase n=1 Tax=Amycolatopsis sp. 195334CR TaxID=2814588 RepID=UPI001A8D9AFF|nr:zinc-binding dehydrogenase [Amycolatopsis sp. 195334CR]MBN6034456.1 zinc-binding dehydrogenase [Amycolatopsis sp. 195334CR]